MKKNFLTGLIIVLPVAITMWVISLLVKVSSAPFTAGAKSILHSLDIVNDGFWIFSADQVTDGIAIIASVSTLLAILFFIGLVSRLLYLHILVKGLERLIARIPVVNNVYRACREFTNIFFSAKSTSFTRVVWVPFPTQSQGVLGLVTNNVTIKLADGKLRKYLSVFPPGTPNPTNAFLLLCQEQTLINTDLSVEESMKWVLSCGTSKPSGLSKATSDLAKKIV